MTAQIIRANALAMPLADNVVDLVVTSPPYFGLRSYQDGGEHYVGQIGAEATPVDFLDALIAATREMVRVLKPSGSIWVNLGDAYYSGKGAPGKTTVDAKSPARTARRLGGNALDGASFGIGRKSLIGIPWRYALRCIDDLGLILRAEVIWSKPNGLPESVTDRVRRSHETWFHFTRSPRYYSAVDEVRERYEAPRATRTMGSVDPSRGDFGKPMQRRNATETMNPLGKLPGSVWTIPTQPLTVPAELGIDHFAAFPMEWPRRIIQGWSPAGVCTACREGRRPVVEKSAYRVVNGSYKAAAITATYDTHRSNTNGQDGSTLGRERDTTITGYACSCPDTTAPTAPAVIIDPFGGTGTTALIAKALGRHGISIDMSADYCRLAQWRTTDEGELARARQVDKPAKQVEGQISLLDMLGDAS